MPNTIKTISKTDTELRVGNYIVLFGGRDLEFLRKGANADGSRGEYFAKSVAVDSALTQQGRLPVDFEHRTDKEVGGTRLGYVDWSTARRDDKGIFVQRVLDRRQRYVQMLEELIEAGLIGNSSEADPEGVRKMMDGGIVSWPLIADTLTVSPADPRMLQGNVLQAMRELANVSPAAKALLDTLINPDGESGEPTGSAKTGAAKANRKPRETNLRSTKSMNILEAIKKLIPGLDAAVYEQIATILGLTGVAVATSPDPVTDESGAEVKSITMADLITAMKALGYEINLPGQKPARKSAAVRPPLQMQPVQTTDDDDDDPAKKTVHAAQMLRFADATEAQKAILGDVIGKDYSQRLHDQSTAYATYLRKGERGLSAEQAKALGHMYFPLDQVVSLVRGGYDTSTIKAVQVEAMGELGGFAVPPEQQADFNKRLPGMTAVRGSGARVAQLIKGNSIEIPEWVGSGDQYIGLLRGDWGDETADPSAKNFKVKMVAITAGLYTYKVTWSASLLEDAANLVSMMQDDIVTTAAMDEDEQFLVGDGVGKPWGILPGGANALSLREVLSGDATSLTADGIKALKRAMPTQYRQNAVWVANSDTKGVIELLKYTGDTHYIFEDLSETDMLLARKMFESGFMPDVAASAYPLLFANMSGYTIVERLGMSIERFHDSGTGINKYEFQVRRRLGGRVEKPWLFDVQKVGEEASI